MNNPSIDAWSALYDESRKFKDLAPWTWMWDSDIFGLQDPVTREIGYCCVMGRKKEHYGMAVYLGTEGLENYLQVQSGLAERDSESAVHSMRCLTVSFEDRHFLDQEDLRMIQILGLKFKGKNTWPKFRSYQPGYYPWYLTCEEVIYLTLCLQHAGEIAMRFKHDSKLLHPLEDGHYFVRRFQSGDSTHPWSDERYMPPPLTRMVRMTKQIRTDQLKRIKGFPHVEGSVWEIDLFPAPAKVGKAGERPFIPVCILFVEQASNFIIHFHMATRREYLVELMEEFLTAIESAGFLPSEIQLKNVELLSFLEPLAQEFSINLKQVPLCPAVDDAKKSMREYFGKHK